MPDLAKDHMYSLGWAGNVVRTDTFKVTRAKMQGKLGVHEFVSYVDSLGKDGLSHVPESLLLADKNGDIGFMMLATIP